MGGLVQKGTERKKTHVAAELWPEFQTFVQKLQEFIQKFFEFVDQIVPL